MKSKESLEKSYTVQSEQWKLSQTQKINNINKQLEAVEQKISKLELARDRLSVTKQNLEKETFESFEDFFRRAEAASQKSKN